MPRVPHYYEIISDGQRFMAACHNSMAEVLRYPSLDAPAEADKETVFAGTTRAYMAWVCRLIRANKTADFAYKQLTAAHVHGTPAAPDVPAPPVHREKQVDLDTGQLTGELKDFDPPGNGVYTVVIRTPYGPPNKEVRETLRGHGMRWNPNDSRGDANYPSPAWLKYHVPGPSLAEYRKLAADLKLDFDYLDKNPVKP